MIGPRVKCDVCGEYYDCISPDGKLIHFELPDMCKALETITGEEP